MSALYDLIIMFDTAVPEDRRAQVLADVEAAISAGGTLESKHDWGVRALTFEIEKKKEADYHLLQFDGPAELLEQLQRTLKFDDSVLRFRIVKLAPGTPAAPSLRQERPAEAPPVESADAAAAQAADSAEGVVADEPAVPSEPGAEAETPDPPAADAEAETPDPPAADADADAVQAEAPAAS